MARTKSLLWVDVGMALFVAAFLAIVLFVRGDLVAPILVGYMVSLAIWAFVAESAAIRMDRHKSKVSVETHTSGASSTDPLLH